MALDLSMISWIRNIKSTGNRYKHNCTTSKIKTSVLTIELKSTYRRKHFKSVARLISTTYKYLQLKNNKINNTDNSIILEKWAKYFSKHFSTKIRK